VQKLSTPLRVRLHVSPAISLASASPLNTKSAAVRRSFEAAFFAPSATVGGGGSGGGGGGDGGRPSTSLPLASQGVRMSSAGGGTAALQAHAGDAGGSPRSDSGASGGIATMAECESCARLRHEVGALREETAWLRTQLQQATGQPVPAYTRRTVTASSSGGNAGGSSPRAQNLNGGGSERAASPAPASPTSITRTKLEKARVLDHDQQALK
jgi:hypothetical protein